MIIFDTTTRKLQMLLAGAVATNQCPCMVAWVDVTTTAYTPGTTVANSNNTTAVDIVAAPASSTYRQLKTLTFYNADTASVTVTIRYNDNGTTYTIVKVTLPTLYHLVYTDTDGWSVYDTAGAKAAVQSLVLTGHVTGSGIGSLVTTIANSVVTEAMQNLADNTTNDVSTTKHGYVPKAPNDTTKFLRGDGTWVAPSGGGGMINRSILTSGTSFTTQSTTTKLVLRMQGGGGGGAGANNAATFNHGGGGGGGYIEKRVTVTGSTAYTYAIGAGGAAGVNGVSSGAGGNGGSTTFTVGATTYTAAGGSGGTASAGGAGGSGTNGDITIPGQNGGLGFISNTDLYAIGGNGGDAVLGHGGLSKGGSVPGGQAGIAGSNYGGGGSANSYAGNGGAGAGGVIIVEEY